jgi:hypothetical protein
MKKLFIICVAITLFGAGHAMADWVTLDYPGAVETWITEIDGSNLVGTYHVSGYFHGFLYNGTSWTTLDYPGARTSISGIDGSNLVGHYRVDPSNYYHGFLYNGTSWTTIDKPEATSTLITAIDGSNFAGYYLDASGNHGFVYNGISWTTLDYPGAAGTYMDGIDGSNLVGKYLDASGDSHGFLYNGTNWITLDILGGTNTNVRGIDGSNLVGSYTDASGDHGFLYNGTSWTTFNYPGATHTYVYAIDGVNLVGYYTDTSGINHGFVYTIPEPTQPPVADADGPYSIFVGDTLTLDGSSSTDDDNDIVSYIWDLDDNGSFETDAGGQAIFDVNYTYLQSLGLLINHPYTIHLKVTDSKGQSDIAGSTLTILPKPAVKVAVDIKPGSCPNPVNVKSSGVLPVAILGSADYDITTIDPTSIRLAGVEPLRSSYEDVATPVSDVNDCNCTTEGPDGFLDLALKFETQRIVEAIGDVNDGDVLTLELTGVLFDPILFERPIEGADCILIRGKHKPINPADINKDGVVNTADFAIFAENWLKSSIVDE